MVLAEGVGASRLNEIGICEDGEEEKVSAEKEEKKIREGGSESRSVKKEQKFVKKNVKFNPVYEVSRVREPVT